MAFVGAFILLLIAVAGVGVLAAMLVAAHHALRRVTHAQAPKTRSICERCGYPGQGLEGRPCPECGGSFLTVSRRERRELLRFVTHPTGAAVAFAVALLLAALTVWAVTLA